MKTNYWRKLEENKVLHVYNRSGSGIFLLKKRWECELFIEKYRKYIEPYVATYSYCLIPNHFHFILRIKPLSQEILDRIRKNPTNKGLRFLNNEIVYSEYLAEQFRLLFDSYAKLYNSKHSRYGSVFQKRYKRILIKSKAEFLYYVFYTLHNPIHHRYCVDYSEYKYSAIHNYLGDKDWIYTGALLKLFSTVEDPSGLASFKKALAYWRNRLDEMRGWMPGDA